MEDLALGVGEHHLDGPAVAGRDRCLGVGIAQAHAVEIDLLGKGEEVDPATGVRVVPLNVRSGAS